MIDDAAAAPGPAVADPFAEVDELARRRKIARGVIGHPSLAEPLIQWSRWSINWIVRAAPLLDRADTSPLDL
jgi:hypothetical protein